jgi:hypothetical protein
MRMFDLRRRTMLEGMGALALAAGLEGCLAAKPQATTGTGLILPLHLAAQGSSMKSGAAAAAPDPSQPQPYIDQVGRGCDTVFDELKGPMVTGTVVRSPVSPTEFDVRNGLKYQMIESQSDYYSLTKKSARAKGRFGLFSGGGGGSKVNEKTSNSYTLHICALARRMDQSYQLNKDTIKLTKDAEAVIRGERDPHRRLRDWGDSFVAGVIPGSELFIDIQFETRSKTAKTNCAASVSASYGKLVSGSGSYSQVISSANSYKKVVVEITGLDATGVPRQYTADEAQRIIEHFLSTPDAQASVWAMNTRPVSDLVLRGRKLDWVDFQEMRRRETFLGQAEASLLYLDNGQTDAEYVRANPGEFDKATQDRAAKDLEEIVRARTAIFGICDDAYADFRNDGQSGPKFDPARITGVLPTLTEYVQVEPSPPPPKPRPKPQPEYRDHDRPHGREG